jgi:uncharacterized protein with NRDE domain
MVPSRHDLSAGRGTYNCGPMCLLVAAWKSHPHYRLIVAANRDEFHERPSAPLGWWNDDPRILSGRDLRASGSWMGVSRSGRFGVVTNFRDLEAAPSADAPSRGMLVARLLAGTHSPQEYLDDLRASAPHYAGFNLLAGGPRELCYFSNRDGAGVRTLETGIYGLSNHLLDAPWPKLRRTRARFAELLSGPDVETESLFDMLGDRRPAAENETPETGLPPEWERALSAPFVIHERYGTRCSTLLLVERDGRTIVHERRFDHGGAHTGTTRIEFTATDTPLDRSPE